MNQFKLNCFNIGNFSGCVPATMMAAANLTPADIEFIEAQVSVEVANFKSKDSMLSKWRDTLRNESNMDFYGVKVNGIQYIGAGVTKVN